MIGVQGQLSAARSIQLSSILRAQYSSGKISFPIDGGLYARFKHVQGVPSASGGGYSLSKLQMIDLMVERLTRLRGEGIEVESPRNDADARELIQDLARQIHTALQSADTARGSFAAGLVEPGLVFDLVA